MQVYRHAGEKLSGIVRLRNRHTSVPVVILGSGPTLKGFDPSLVPEEWPIVAVNEAVAYGGRVDYWVLSDEPIVREYAHRCPMSVEILAMNEATLTIRKAVDGNVVHTVESMAKPAEYENGFEFFSRGTVLIGAIEMFRWMGVRRFFCFGLDLYRTKTEYYYDGRKPGPTTEHKFLNHERVRKTPRDVDIWVTAKLKRMIQKLQEAKASGLWDKVEIFCVNSPYSQQDTFPKITLEEFDGFAKRYDHAKKRKSRRHQRAMSDRVEGADTEDGSLSVDPEGDGDEGGPSDPDVVAGAGGHDDDGEAGGGGDSHGGDDGRDS